MDIIKPTLTVSQSNEDNEIVNIIETLEVYNEEGHVMNFNDYDLRLLHHRVRNLNSKVLDMAVMLTVDNLNVNILCFTEHLLL